MTLAQGLREVSRVSVQQVVDSLARVARAGVTLEDPDGWVIAYSAHACETDSSMELDTARIHTILSRRVPERVLEYLHKKGVYERVATEQGVTVVGPFPEIGLGQRAVAAVRCDGELVAIVWLSGIEGAGEVARLAEPILAACRQLSEALWAEVVLGSMQTQLLVNLAAMSGSSRDPWREEALQLVLEQVCPRVTPPFCAVVVRPLRAERKVSKVLLHRSVKRFMSVRGLSEVLGFLGEDLVAVVAGAGAGDTEVGAALDALVADLAGCLRVRVGVGTSCEYLADIGQSYRQALEALQAASDLGGETSGVFRYDELGIYGLLRCLTRCDCATNYGKKFADRLAEYDAQHGTDYLLTLEKYLERRGDCGKVAQMLCIHPNTLRYRLDKITRISGIDLESPDECLAGLIWIKARRLAALGRGSSAPGHVAGNPQVCPRRFVGSDDYSLQRFLYHDGRTAPGA